MKFINVLISLFILLIISILLTNCGGSAYSEKYQRESIDANISSVPGWRVYEVYINENGNYDWMTHWSSSEASEANAYRVILSPLFFGDEKSSNQNDKVFENWIDELRNTNSIYYVAYRKYSDSLNYEQALVAYNKWINENGGKSGGLKVSDIESLSFMVNPEKIVKNGERKYDFKGYPAILGGGYFIRSKTQNDYGLTISKGFAKLKK